MQKRKVIFGNYDTAVAGWTLTGWKLSDAVQKTKYVEKSGGDGSWDLSTAMTDGVPKYKDRTLTATFECSEGDRLSREAQIRQMVNTLDGRSMNIYLPDDDSTHLEGRVHVKRDYNDPAHAAVTVTATCAPWKFFNDEQIIELTATTTMQTVELVNAGGRVAVPVITITGTGTQTLLLKLGTATKAFGDGVYQWPVLVLTPGAHELQYVGVGTATLTYREAVLE